MTPLVSGGRKYYVASRGERACYDALLEGRKTGAQLFFETEVPPRAIACGRIVGNLRTDLVGAVEEVNCRGSTGCDYTVSLGRAPPILRSSAVVGDRYDGDSISFVLEDDAVRKPLHACLPKNIV